MPIGEHSAPFGDLVAPGAGGVDQQGGAMKPAGRVGRPSSTDPSYAAWASALAAQHLAAARPQAPHEALVQAGDVDLHRAGFEQPGRCDTGT